jgi:dipeptidase
MYRPVGVNRTNFLSIIQIRPYMPEAVRALQWIAFASNVFNAIAPFYANVEELPDYLTFTEDTVSTDSFYWSSRLIGALADAHFAKNAIHIERYQNKVFRRSHELLAKLDRAYLQEGQALEKANLEIADMLREETDRALGNVLHESTKAMINAFSRADA